jgi:hypothetical protein
LVGPIFADVPIYISNNHMRCRKLHSGRCVGILRLEGLENSLICFLKGGEKHEEAWNFGQKRFYSC